MAGSSYEKVLAAEWLAVMAIETGDALAKSGGKSTLSLPNPAQYMATMIVFLSLAGVAMFGEHAGKLAAAFGGVAAIAILLVPMGKGKNSPLVGFLAYVNALMTGNAGGFKAKAKASTPITGSVAPSQNQGAAGTSPNLSTAQVQQLQQGGYIP